MPKPDGSQGVSKTICRGGAGYFVTGIRWAESVSCAFFEEKFLLISGTMMFALRGNFKVDNLCTIFSYIADSICVVS